MSKLFLISEEEKNRILNLHESATKRQYLSEQEKYVVKRGDTLSKIALSNNTTVNAIASANDISDVNMIRVGQTLNIPKNNNSTTSPDVKTKEKPLDNNRTDSPFKNKEEGNEFRKWVNDTLPSWAKKLKLDPSGSHTNSFIINAWNYNIPLKSGKTMKLGEYYKSKNPTTDKEKKGTIEIMPGFSPEFKNQINFDGLKINDTTKNFCKPNDNECAQFINDISDDIKAGDVGNAWNAYVNTSKLGDTIYSSFKNLNKQQINDVINIWQEINKRPSPQKWEEKGPKSTNISNIVNSLVPISYNGPELKAGDVVGIYYRGSKNHERAFYEGAKAGKGWFVNGKPGNTIKKGEGWGMNTHIGRVGVVKNGVPLIFHNVDGTTKSDPQQNLRIAWVKRK